MAFRFHPHARERMRERGAYEEEVSVTIELTRTISSEIQPYRILLKF